MKLHLCTENQSPNCRKENLRKVERNTPSCLTVAETNTLLHQRANSDSDGLRLFTELPILVFCPDYKTVIGNTLCTKDTYTSETGTVSCEM